MTRTIINGAATALAAVLLAGVAFGCSTPQPAPAEPAPAEPGDSANGAQNPQVTIEIDGGGIIVLELLPEYAPNTVNNFISLVKSGFYDGTIFHRTIPDFMIQGGDPDGVGTGGPGYAIKGEFYSNGFEQNTLPHSRGVLSMARAMAPDSAGSQFFICVADVNFLDGEYAAFGRVLSGMEVADEIVSGPNNGDEGIALEPRTMVKVTVDTFGVEYPEPETIAE
jgi:peptidyl-prolyl cis-trans isomerase B (cyclophilin B)